MTDTTDHETIERLTRERDEARSRFNEIDLCHMGQAPCDWAMTLIRERDEAVSALPQAIRAERRRAEAAEAELARLKAPLEGAKTTAAHAEVLREWVRAWPGQNAASITVPINHILSALDHATAAARLATERENEACADLAMAEPELEGDAPPELYNLDPVEVARAAVRATKKSIAAAIRARHSGKGE